MAFTYTRNPWTPGVGGLAYVTGTYNSSGAGVVGGAINTELRQVLFFNSNNETSQATTETLVAINKGIVTITTVEEEDGTWLAIGS